MRRAQPLNPPQWENELNNSSPWRSGALRRGGGSLNFSRLSWVKDKEMWIKEDILTLKSTAQDDAGGVRWDSYVLREWGCEGAMGRKMHDVLKLLGIKVWNRDPVDFAIPTFEDISSKIWTSHNCHSKGIVLNHDGSDAQGFFRYLIYRKHKEWCAGCGFEFSCRNKVGSKSS